MPPSSYRTISAGVVAAQMALWIGVAASPAEEMVPVELELVLALDASGSVDRAEFDLQLRGLADAFRSPGVVAAIRTAAPEGIAVAVVQWAGPGHQILAVGWTEVRDAASAANFADRIEAAGRQMHGETAIAQALGFAMASLESNRFEGRRKVIDLSGDGPTNFGRAPDPMRDRVVSAAITINGLVILNEWPDLDRYFRQHVIGGPGAFVVIATEYRDYADAIRLKLIREIQGVPVAEAVRQR